MIQSHIGNGAFRKSCPYLMSVAITEYPALCMAETISISPQAGSQITVVFGRSSSFSIASVASGGVG